MKKEIKIFLSILAIFCLSFFTSKVARAEIRSGADYECDKPDDATTWTCFVKPGGTVDFQISASDPDNDRLYFLLYWGDVAGYVQSPAACPVNLATCIASGAVPPYSIGHGFTTSPGTYVSYAKVCDEHNTFIPPVLEQCTDSNEIFTHISQFNLITHRVSTTSSPGWQTMPAYFVESNDVITYKISFTVGGGAMHKLLVQDDFPAGAAYVASSGNCGTYNTPGSRSGNRVTWDLGAAGVDVVAGSVCDFSVSVRRTPNDCASNIALINNFTLTAQNANPATKGGTVTINCPKNWWQTFWGDIHAQGSILNKEPNPSVDKSADFMITAGLGISGANSKELSEIALYHQLYFSAADWQKLVQGVTANCNDNNWRAVWIPQPPTLPQTTTLWQGNQADANKHYCNGNLSLAVNPNGSRPAGYSSEPPALFLERGGTIVVAGNLDIVNNVYYDPNPNFCSTPPAVECRLKLPSAGFVVAGNLNIGDKVRHLAGNFYVLGDVYTDDTEDSELIIEGSLVARGALNLQRKYKGDGDDPAEIVRYDGRVLVNPPPGFLDPATILSTWAWIRP